MWNLVEVCGKLLVKGRRLAYGTDRGNIDADIGRGGELMEACREYLQCEREREPDAGGYIDGLLAVHRVRFDEIDAQLTALEKIS